MSSVVLGWGKGCVGNTTVSVLLAARGYGLEIQNDFFVNPDVPVRIIVLTSLFDLESYKILRSKNCPIVNANKVVFVINKCSEQGKGILEEQMALAGLTVSAYLPSLWYLYGVSENKCVGLALSKSVVRDFINDLVVAVGNDHFPLP